MATVLAGPLLVDRVVAREIAYKLGYTLAGSSLRRFPDGEMLARVDDAERLEGTVVIVKTMARPMAESLLQAAMLADAARGLGAERIVMVSPYLAFARQDRRFLPGEPVTAALAVKTLASSGVDALVAVEVHKEAVLEWFPGGRVNVRPYRYMADIAGLKGGDILVLAPDLGALERARMLATHIGAGYDYLVKKRDRITGEVVIEPKSIDARGKRVVIVDDIVSTGGTVAKAAASLLGQGAKSVEVMVAHWMGVPGTPERLRAAGVSRVIAGLTLPPAETGGLVEYVDLAPLLAESIRELA